MKNETVSSVQLKWRRKLKDGVRRFSDITGNITEYIFVTFHFSFQSNLIRTSVSRALMEKSRYGRGRIFHTLQKCFAYGTKDICSFAQRSVSSSMVQTLVAGRRFSSWSLFSIKKSNFFCFRY